MNLVQYYHSITKEMMSTKDRVRDIINDRHWQTDGEWKESVLRTVLKRHMPNNLGIGRGFVVSEYGSSTQIDVLIYDKSYPILFKDGDLVFVTPESVRGIIEVKSNYSNTNLDRTFNNLASNANLIKRSNFHFELLFVGAFFYEKGVRNVNDDLLFQKLSNAYHEKGGLINHVCIGNNRFYKYWDNNPDNMNEKLNAWHSYNLFDSCIPYFINNLLNDCSNERIDMSADIWFQYDQDNPLSRKEEVRVNVFLLRDEENE